MIDFTTAHHLLSEPDTKLNPKRGGLRTSVHSHQEIVSEWDKWTIMAGETIYLE